jgi:hypothetical protein
MENTPRIHTRRVSVPPATMATLTPFDLVSAAEQLLQNVKAFAASRIPGQEDDLRDLRRAIAQTARKIWLETAPTPDVVRADWITVRLCFFFFLPMSQEYHAPLQEMRRANHTRGLVS